MINKGNKEDILTDKEIHFVKQFISRYNLDIIKAYRIQKVYKLYSRDNNCYCLKGVNKNKNKIINGNNLVEVLYKNNFYNTPRYYRDRKGHLFNSYRKNLFYITDWVEGSGINLDSMIEAKKVARLLGEFHLKSEKLDRRLIKLKNTSRKNISNSFMENIYLLNRFDIIIKNKRLKTSFDYEYKQYINVFTNLALISLNILNTCAYSNILNNSSSMVICHNKIDSKNIIKNPNGIFMINFNYLSYDLKINDLGKYIRKIMIRNTCKWNFQKCKELIESYNEVYTLSREELLLMLALILFPYKFCKLGKKRYVKNKSWPESKYIFKLKKVIKQCKIKTDFISDYMEYVNSYE